MTQSLDPFKTALKFTLKWESNSQHSQNLSSVIHRGITQATYNAYRRKKKLPQQPVNQITDAEFENVYYELYWLVCHGNLMVLPLAVVHFDTAVNFSIKASIEFLQESLGGLTVDGIWGQQTLAALEKENNWETAKRYSQARINYRYWQVDANPSEKIFLDEWLKRDKDLLNYARELAGEDLGENLRYRPPEETFNSTEIEAELFSESTVEVTLDNSQNISEKLDRAIALLQEVAIAIKKFQSNK